MDTILTSFARLISDRRMVLITKNAAGGTIEYSSDDQVAIARACNSHAALVEALQKIAQFQPDVCARADEGMLFILLDVKVGIARAALALAGIPQLDPPGLVSP